LEHILSPDKINFLYEETLIEEHIMGIPGMFFIKTLLDDCSDTEKSQIAKEFKFNERCMIRLLGDMRAYNYVIVPFTILIRWFTGFALSILISNVMKNFKIYRPQFFQRELSYGQTSQG
jgi:hypothetical protein